MATGSRVKVHTQADVMAIARKAKRDPTALTAIELRALAMFVLDVEEPT